MTSVDGSTVEPPDAEAIRLQALHDLHLLDTPPEERFDRITRLAARLLQLPIAQINLLDLSRQWTKSGYGAGAVELPRTLSFCSHTIGRPGIFEVRDARLEPLFAGNPLVHGAPGVRFYAGRALRTGDGYAVGTLCVIGREPRELTDEERGLIDALGAWAEAELRRVELRDLLARREANEQLLRGILHSMLDAVLLVTPDGRVEASNLAAERLFGYDEVGLERPLNDLVSDLRPADLSGTDGSDEAESPKHAGPMERMALTASGHSVPVELTVTLLRDQAGERHVVLVRDLRPLQESQDELRRAQRLNELILSSASEGICSVDRDGRITSSNVAAARILGRRSSELAGAVLHDIAHHSRPDRSPYPFSECPLYTTLATGRPSRVRQDTLWHRDGAPVPVESASAPIYEGDEIVGAVATFVDISDQIAVNRMKDEFLSLVSHELRTPLTSIRGSLGLLAGGVFGPLGAEPRQMLDIAITNTDRLVRLVNDILDLERLETGRFTLDRRPADLGRVMTTAVEGVQGVATEAGVRLAVQPLLLQVFVDRDRIVQALTNLLGNAVKFSPPGSEVTLDARIADGSVELRVQDRGRGIPPDKLERIFQRFEQVDASDARDKGGTGLGLPIARSITERHEGRLWAESTLGVGSTFYLELPIALPPEASHSSTSVGLRAFGSQLVAVGEAAPGTGPGDSLSRAVAQAGLPPWLAHRADEVRRVLIVEDDPDVATVLAAQLQERGLCTSTAATERDAINLTAATRPDVIVLDVALAQGDGFGLVRALREQGRCGDTSLVIYTVRELSPEEQDRLRTPQTVFLVKGRATTADVADSITALLGSGSTSGPDAG